MSPFFFPIYIITYLGRKSQIFRTKTSMNLIIFQNWGIIKEKGRFKMKKGIGIIIGVGIYIAGVVIGLSNGWEPINAIFWPIVLVIGFGLLMLFGWASGGRR